jgi:hypothetical protein
MSNRIQRAAKTLTNEVQEGRDRGAAAGLSLRQPEKQCLA